MKYTGAFFFCLGVLAGSIGGSVIASPSPADDGDGSAIRDGESFRMGLLALRQNRATGTNLQAFTGALGVTASAITNSGDPDRPFEVDGDTFVCLHTTRCAPSFPLSPVGVQVCG